MSFSVDVLALYMTLTGMSLIPRALIKQSVWRWLLIMVMLCETYNYTHVTWGSQSFDDSSMGQSRFIPVPINAFSFATVM